MVKPTSGEVTALKAWFLSVHGKREILKVRICNKSIVKQIANWIGFSSVKLCFWSALNPMNTQTLFKMVRSNETNSNIL